METNNLSGFLMELGFVPLKGNPSEYAYTQPCWSCGRKNKVFFNTNKMVGLCFSCPRTIYISDIASELAGIRDAKQIRKFIEEQESQRHHEIGFREAVLEGLLGTGNEPYLTQLQEIRLPNEYRSLEDGCESVTGKRAIAYLLDRGFYPSTLFSMWFGYCGTGRYEDRVIVPFWEFGRLVYWQARDFTGRKPKSEKVLNPPGGWVNHGKSDVLFNYDVASEQEFLIITESWGSALAVGKYAVGINGKTMSEVQERKILTCKAETVITLLDAGCTEETWSISRRLAPYKKVFNAFLPEGDPNELPRSVVNQCIRAAKLYNRMDDLTQMIGNATRRWKL